MAEESALVVPVPAAELPTGDLRNRFDPVARAGIPAHITVLYPFIPPASIDKPCIEELVRIFAGVVPFSFTLVRIERFPGVVYLAPEPGEPFLRLTGALSARWQEAPPYGGAYDEVIPHLTVAHTEDPSVIEAVRRRVEPTLPISCFANEALLFTNQEAKWTVEERFPFEGQAHWSSSPSGKTS